jgi:hypothetical protein
MPERRQRTDKIKPTRSYSKVQEKYVASKFGGKCTPNSGATPFQKGDVSLDKLLIECKTKTTKSESMSIKKEWLEKNEKEALFMGKSYSALAFNFGPNEKNYYIIDEYLFEILMNALNDEDT